MSFSSVSSSFQDLQTESVAPQMELDANSHSRTKWSATLKGLVPVALVISLLVTAIGWALASPIDGSPDDDYHLTSIWCPPPLESSGCAAGPVHEDHGKSAIVPQIIAQGASCLAFHTETSAACQSAIPEDTTGPSYRLDNGYYPPGFYKFHHLFTSDNVAVSVVLMRMINAFISIALLGTIIWLSPNRFRQNAVFALLISWVPMGIYFIVSNNPTSWALTGIFAYALGLHASLHQLDWRRWTLLTLALFGAFIAAEARADAGFFITVVSIAVWTANTFSKKRVPHIIASVVASIFGVFMMMSTNHSDLVESSVESETHYGWMRIIRLILGVPEYFAGMIGYHSGPGWFDVPLDGPATLFALLLVGFFFFRGLQDISVRKTLTAVIMLGALAGIPIVVSLPLGYVELWQYQPRYLLPLLAVFFLFWFALPEISFSLTKSQIAMVVFFSAIVHAFALNMVLARYTMGITNENVPLFPLRSGVTWWWSIPVSPLELWLISSFAFAITVAIAGIYFARQSNTAEIESQDLSTVD